MSRYTLYKYTARLMAVLLALMLLLSALPQAYAAEASGSCGDNLTWSFSAGTLTITGSGEMTNFTEDTMSPWYDLRPEILRLELPAGLTNVGDLAFYGCKNLTVVTIPDSVTRIGEFAFTGCSAVEILNLGSGVKEIGQYAFSECEKIAALRLPSGLEKLGMKVFYRCESLTAVMIPASVVKIGVSAFGYCKNLITADVRANISQIPEYLFYGCPRLTSVSLPDNLTDAGDFAFRGCDQLRTVHYGGSAISPEQLKELVNQDVPDFNQTGTVSDEAPSGTGSSGYATENSDGTLTWESNTVTQGEDMTASSKVETVKNPQTYESQSSLTVDLTITDETGWETAKDTLQSFLSEYEGIVESQEAEKGKVNIHIYVSNTGSVDRDFVQSLASENVTVTVTTQDGSSWRVETEQLNVGAEALDLGFTITAGTAELCEELGTDLCFQVRFHAPVVINAEVLMNLGANLAMQNATLFQRLDGEVSRVQSTVVDRDGRAHFYLGSVSDEIPYYIAMNLPEVDDAIVPEELTSDYGKPEYVEPIKYEITGVKSSWGMTFGQVSWILAGVLVGCVIIVGIVMYVLNKRKLRMGYVPDLDEEDLP